MSYDCTGKIGSLFSHNSQFEWPMYSFDRPGYIVWNAIAGKLHAAGWSVDQIKAYATKLLSGCAI